MPEVRCRELPRITQRGQWTRQALWFELDTELSSILENNLQLEMAEHTEAHDS